jgi:hypothetical protein
VLEVRGTNYFGDGERDPLRPPSGGRWRGTVYCTACHGEYTLDDLIVDFDCNQGRFLLVCPDCTGGRRLDIIEPKNGPGGTAAADPAGNLRTFSPGPAA